MLKSMASKRLRPPARDPTPQQWKFAEACANGLSLVDAFVLAYPARREPRSREGERVKAKRMAKNPTVVWAMEKMAERRAEEDAIENPEQVRKECLIALRRIRLGRLDPSCARAVLVELREANRALDRRKEEAHGEQRAQRAVLERAFRQQFDRDFKKMITPTPKANAVGTTAARTLSAVSQQTTPSVQPYHAPLEDVAVPTAPNDEVQDYLRNMRAQQEDRKRAAKNPLGDLLFPTKPAWATGDVPRPRTTTLPTFTAHRTRKNPR
jgi:hypothetical protein